MSIIAVAGFATSGKTTAAERLVTQHGYTAVGWADKLRQSLYALNPIVGVGTDRDRDSSNVSLMRYRDLVDDVGYHEAKFHFRYGTEVRRLLQSLGTEAGRDVLGSDVWVNALLDSLPEGPVVIHDTRFPNEVAGAMKRGGLVIRINRPGVGPLNDHPSETSLIGVPVDVEVENDGTVADLHAKIDSIVADLADGWEPRSRL